MNTNRKDTPDKRKGSGIQFAEKWRANSNPFGPSVLMTSYPCRADWLDARRTGIGASESAGIFGVGYVGQSPLTVWDEKVNGTRTEVDAKTQRMFDRGKEMEPIIAREFTHETGLTLTDPGEFTIFRTPAFRWMFATIDRTTVDDHHGPIPVELKNVSGILRNEWREDEEPPLKFMVQCHHQMLCTNTRACYLAGWIGGEKLAVRLIERNEQFIFAMLKKLVEFWKLVETKQMPEIDESDATAGVLKRMYPVETPGEEVVLPFEAAEWDRILQDAKATEKEAAETVRLMKNRLIAAIGDAEFGIIPGGATYSNKQQSRKEFVSPYTEYRVLRRKS